MRQILHVDMDAFFASVEELYDPSLRGKPVLVGFDGPRSVVCAASYAARQFGARSAMPMSMALRLCPHAIVVPVHRERYLTASQAVFKIFEEFTPEVEGLSLDEAFLDVTHSQTLFGNGEQIATRIRARIQHELGLTASAGVAANKFVAKIASDQNKPNGLCVVPADVAAFLAPLPIARMWGVGPKSVDRFIALGLRTFGDLQVRDDAWLLQTLGANGVNLKQLAWGVDTRPVTVGADAKSVSSESTYAEDLTRLHQVQRELLHHAEVLARRLTREELQAATIHIKLKYANFSLGSRQLTVPEPIADAQSIYEVALVLLPKVFSDGESVRLVGVGVSGLDHVSARPRLFVDPTLAKRGRVEALALAVAAKTGVAVTRATLLGAAKPSDPEHLPAQNLGRERKSR
jgi:DNA polymerase IV